MDEFIIAKGDSRASCHFFRPGDASVLEDIAEHNGPPVHQPDNTALTSQGTGNVPLLKKNSKQDQQAMILKNLKKNLHWYPWVSFVMMTVRLF